MTSGLGSHSKPQIWHGPVGPVLTNPLLTGNFAAASPRLVARLVARLKCALTEKRMGVLTGISWKFMGFSSDLMVCNMFDSVFEWDMNGKLMGIH